MDRFNRIVTTLLLLALIPIITVALIAPREGVQFLTDVLDQIELQLDSSPSSLQTLIRVIVAVLIDALLVILLYLEVRRPASTTVRVQQVKGGEAVIAVDSIVSRLSYQIDRLPGVLDVTPTVKPRRRSVEVTLDIEMAADGDIPANIEDISRVTRRVIEDDLGVRLKGKPKLNLRTVEYPGPLAAAEIQPPVFVKTDTAIEGPAAASPDAATLPIEPSELVNDSSSAAAPAREGDPAGPGIEETLGEHEVDELGNGRNAA